MNRQVLLLTTDFPPMSGGIANFLHHICHLLGAAAHAVVPDTPGAAAFDREQPYAVTRLSVDGHSLWSRNLILPLKWAATVQRNRPGGGQVVVAGGFVSSAILLTLVYLSLRLPVQTLLVVHGGDVRPLVEQWWRWPWRWLLRRVDRFVTNSHFTRRLLIEQLGIDSARIQVFHPGVEAAHFRQGQPVAIAGWPEDRQVILSVGRLVPHKGHDKVLRAVAQLVEAGVHVGYIIVGRGPEESRLRQLAASLQLDDRVHFAGFVDDRRLPDYYHTCDIFVLVSREEAAGGVEGFGIVYLEAGAAGKPVVAGRGGGVEDAVVDGQSGILVDPCRVDDIADALRLLSVDKEKRLTMGQYGQDRVETEFDWDKRLVELRQTVS
jgi:phosphatidyl-myo-inositol dimannoside synthase